MNSAMKAFATFIIILLFFNQYIFTEGVKDASEVVNKTFNARCNPTKNIKDEDVINIVETISKAITKSNVFQGVLSSDLPQVYKRKIVIHAMQKCLTKANIKYSNILSNLTNESIKLNAHVVSASLVSAITSVKNLTTCNVEEFLKIVTSAFLEGIVQGAANKNLKLSDKLAFDIKNITDSFKLSLLKIYSTSQPDYNAAKLFNSNGKIIRKIAWAFKRTYTFLSLFQPKITLEDRNKILSSAFNMTINNLVQQKINIEINDKFYQGIMKLRKNSDALTYATVLATSLPMVFEHQEDVDTMSTFLVKFTIRFLNMVFSNKLNDKQEISKMYLLTDIAEVTKTIRLLISKLN